MHAAPAFAEALSLSSIAHAGKFGTGKSFNIPPLVEDRVLLGSSPTEPPDSPDLELGKSLGVLEQDPLAPTRPPCLFAAAQVPDEIYVTPKHLHPTPARHRKRIGEVAAHPSDLAGGAARPLDRIELAVRSV